MESACLLWHAWMTRDTLETLGIDKIVGNGSAMSECEVVVNTDPAPGGSGDLQQLLAAAAHSCY
jgi:hypothetical protein